MEFFKKYPETFLVVVAAVLVAIILGSFAWGIGSIFNALDGSVNFSGGNGSAPAFNLSGAAKLDLRGLYLASITTSTATTTDGSD